MRIAICDDEVSVVEILEEKIKMLLPDAVIEKYLSGEELILSSCKPDILFLDIQMPGKDGMETARILREDNKDMILIFVTAVEEYVFQAFDVGAFHYLVKPFSDEKLKEVLTKAVHIVKNRLLAKEDQKYIMIQLLSIHRIRISSIMENYRNLSVWQGKIFFVHTGHIWYILNI